MRTLIRWIVVLALAAGAAAGVYWLIGPGGPLSFGNSPKRVYAACGGAGGFIFLVGALINWRAARARARQLAEEEEDEDYDSPSAYEPSFASSSPALTPQATNFAPPPVAPAPDMPASDFAPAPAFASASSFAPTASFAPAPVFSPPAAATPPASTFTTPSPFLAAAPTSFGSAPPSPPQAPEPPADSRLVRIETALAALAAGLQSVRSDSGSTEALASAIASLEAQQRRVGAQLEALANRLASAAAAAPSETSAAANPVATPASGDSIRRVATTIADLRRELGR